MANIPQAGHARFAVTAFTPERMMHLGTTFLGALNQRLDRGENVLDAPAKPLSKKYAKYKARKHPPAIRNMRFTGITRGTTRVLSAGTNRALIGTADTKSNMILAINKHRDQQWGMSPKDRQAVEKQMITMHPVTAGKQ